MSSMTKRPTEARWDPGLFRVRLGRVAVARFRGGEFAEVGCFLVETGCVGVKDAFLAHMTIYEYERGFIPRIFGETPTRTGELMAPACARALIEAAVAYAGRLGIAPHPDYKAACRVFGGIAPDAGGRTFTFGSEGKPHFTPGPHDSPEWCRVILGLLHTHCGEDNYHWTIPDTLFAKIFPPG